MNSSRASSSTSPGGTCFFAGTSGGCTTSIPYTCNNSSSCSSSSTCSNLSACNRSATSSDTKTSGLNPGDDSSLAEFLIADKDLAKALSAAPKQ